MKTYANIRAEIRAVALERILAGPPFDRLENVDTILEAVVHGVVTDKDWSDREMMQLLVDRPQLLDADAGRHGRDHVVRNVILRSLRKQLRQEVSSDLKEELTTYIDRWREEGAFVDPKTLKTYSALFETLKAASLRQQLGWPYEDISDLGSLVADFVFKSLQGAIWTPDELCALLAERPDLLARSVDGSGTLSDTVVRTLRVLLINEIETALHAPMVQQIAQWRADGVFEMEDEEEQVEGLDR